MFPGEKHFNADIKYVWILDFNMLRSNRREYQPISLIELSRLIDLGWIDPTRPIDIAALCRTRKFKIEPHLRQCGFDLTAEVIIHIFCTIFSGFG